MTNLTDRSVAAAKTQRQSEDIPDGKVRGLFLRVTSHGAKSWGLRYTDPAGKRRRLSLGIFPGKSLMEARDLAVKALGALADGRDPAATERRGEFATFEQLGREFAEKYSRRDKKKATAGEDVRMLETYVYPVIGSMRPEKIEQKHIRDVTEQLLSRPSLAKRSTVDPAIATPGARQANKVLTLLKTLFRWAVNEGLLRASPIVGAYRKDEAPARKRVLDEQELGALYRAIPVVFGGKKSEHDPRIAMARLLMILPSRKNEIILMERSELHLDALHPMWVLPKTRAKNRRAKNATDHVTPLPPQAVAILRDALAHSTDDRYVFGSPSGGPFAHNILNDRLRLAFGGKKIVVDRDGASIPIAPFVLHDLRRSIATHMTRMSVPRLIVAKLLNHSAGDRDTVTGEVYDRNEYLPERRTALEQWANRMEALAAGRQQSNVVEMAC
jgi:integrase